jgi:hypothetical protein
MSAAGANPVGAAKSSKTKLNPNNVRQIVNTGSLGDSRQTQRILFTFTATSLPIQHEKGHKDFPCTASRFCGSGRVFRMIPLRRN